MSHQHQIPLHDTPRTLSHTPRQHTPTRSRPTTPLRPSSRSSLRSSHSQHGRSSRQGGFALDNPLEEFEPAFAELSDSMADLEANFMHLQLMHESLARFSENFAGFLYGLNMNAFCVDFPEAPTTDSFRRAKEKEDHHPRATSSDRYGHNDNFDGETTFMTTDTSFVDNPPSTVTSKAQTPKKLTTPKPVRTTGAPGRGGASSRGGTARGGLRGTRGSGLARGTRGSGIPSRLPRA